MTMSELRLWQQLLIALIVGAAMGAGNWVAGMCGGIMSALVALILVQVFRVSMRPAERHDDSPGG